MAHTPDPDDAFHAPTCPDFCPGPPDEHLRVSASVAENRTVPALRKQPGTRPPLQGSDDMPNTSESSAHLHDRGR